MEDRKVEDNIKTMDKQNAFLFVFLMHTHRHSHFPPQSRASGPTYISLTLHEILEATYSESMP